MRTKTTVRTSGIHSSAKSPRGCGAVPATSPNDGEQDRNLAHAGVRADEDRRVHPQELGAEGGSSTRARSGSANRGCPARTAAAPPRRRSARRARTRGTRTSPRSNHATTGSTASNTQFSTRTGQREEETRRERGSAQPGRERAVAPRRSRARAGSSSSDGISIDADAACLTCSGDHEQHRRRDQRHGAVHAEAAQSDVERRRRQAREHDRQQERDAARRTEEREREGVERDAAGGPVHSRYAPLSSRRCAWSRYSYSSLKV